MSLKCLFYGHDIESKQRTTREWWGSYSPSEGTIVTENIHTCLRCGKDLTDEVKMEMYRRERDRQWSEWLRSKSYETQPSEAYRGG